MSADSDLVLRNLLDACDRGRPLSDIHDRLRVEVGRLGCPECGGTGARGCGAGWHDGKPDAPSPLGEPTAVPTRPTREQATQALLDATEAISAYINAGGADGCLDSANVIGIWSTDGRQARITQGDLRRIAEVRAALLAGEGTAQPDPDGWIEVTPDALTRACDRAHASPNAAEVGHREGFCLACAELRVAMSGASGEGTAAPDHDHDRQLAHLVDEWGCRGVMLKLLADLTDDQALELLAVVRSNVVGHRASGEGTASLVPQQPDREQVRAVIAGEPSAAYDPGDEWLKQAEYDPLIDGAVWNLDVEGLTDAVMALLASSRPPPQPDPPVTVTYTNWQGETAERHIIPVGLWWGVTEWHPRSGWLLDAWDVDRQAMRSFSLNGFDLAKVVPIRFDEWLPSGSPAETGEDDTAGGHPGGDSE